MIDPVQPPQPMSRRQLAAVVVLTAAVAGTRVWGRAVSLWDWDEVLFALAVRGFDVSLHHPQPPGFPLFIAAAKLLGGLSGGEFAALQWINLAAGVLAVPAMVALGRELRLSFTTSLAAAGIFAFFPNVWFFGEGALSDVPAAVITVAACALLLRGGRSAAAWLLGAALLGVAIGIRPQNLLVGAAPLLLAGAELVRHRRMKTLLAGGVLILTIVGAAYGGAAAATGWEAYQHALATHSEYIARTDSFRSDARPALYRVFDDFFVRPYHAPLINTLVTLLALLSMVGTLWRRHVPLLIALAAWGPLCVASWLMLDRFSASRFSVGYAPLFAILAADGLALLTPKSTRIQGTLALVLIALMVVWTLPAIRVIRAGSSPPVRALRSIPADSDVLVSPSLEPYADYYAQGRRVVRLGSGVPGARFAARPAWYVREGALTREGASRFSWSEPRLSELTRGRYLQVSTVPVQPPRFAEGWYEAEQSSREAWRWMGERGVITLPGAPRVARLSLRFHVPVQAMGTSPFIQLAVNGTSVATITAVTSRVEWSGEVPARPESNELVVTTSRTVSPAAAGLGVDARQLGLRLEELEWSAVR